MNSGDELNDGAHVGRSGTPQPAGARRRRTHLLARDLLDGRADRPERKTQRHPEATFLMRGSGSDMAEARIADGEALLIDRLTVTTRGLSWSRW